MSQKAQIDIFKGEEGQIQLKIFDAEFKSAKIPKS